MPIKSWALDDRPREKLIEKGKESLSDTELIAILIGSGNREETAVDLSKRILQSTNNNLNDLGKLSLEQLKKFKGVGTAKAVTIAAALELGKRRQFEKLKEKDIIKSSKDVFDIMQSVLSDLNHEEFWVLYLNNSNKVLLKHQVSKGGLTATLVDVRLLFKKAIELFAVGIILCHNHPSGKLKPSNSDKELTNKIKSGSVSLDIKLLDHLIVTQKSYFSFADNGLI